MHLFQVKPCHRSSLKSLCHNVLCLQTCTGQRNLRLASLRHFSLLQKNILCISYPESSHCFRDSHTVLSLKTKQNSSHQGRTTPLYAGLERRSAKWLCKCINNRSQLPSIYPFMNSMYKAHRVSVYCVLRALKILQGRTSSVSQVDFRKQTRKFKAN